jgi:uncharacterized membrane protein YdbT with pleckstrin-like domain
MKCEVCGENMASDAVFCPKCGERRKSVEAAAPATGVEKMRQTMSSKMIDPKADEPEAVLWQGSYSPKAMVGGWLLSLVVTIVAFVAGFAATTVFPPALFVAVAVSLAVWGGHLALLIYQRMSHEYKLTSQRFVHSSGLLRRVTDRIEVIDIDDVQVTQGFIERFLGVGTIRLLSSDVTSPLTTLVGINDVTRIATLIDDTRRTERRKRSVHIESV